MSLRETLTDEGYGWVPQPNRHPVYPFLTATREGNVVQVSGQVPFVGETKVTGKVGADVDLARAQFAAELCAVNCLFAAGSVVEPEDIVRIKKMEVFVNVAPGFTQMPEVANGASEFLERVLGEAGLGARYAIGVASLPMDAAVEIAMEVVVR